MGQFLDLVDDTHRIFDVELKRDPGARFLVELAYLGDCFEDRAAEMLLHHHQDHIPLGFESQTKEGFGLLDAFASGLGYDSGTRGTCFA